MAEKDAEAAALEEQKQAELAFDGGFSEQETPAAGTETPKVEEPPVAEPPPPAPEFITKADFEKMLEQNAAKTASLEKQISHLNGANAHLKGVVEKLQTQPAGEATIELDPEFEKDFSEVAAGIKRAKVRGATATVTANPDPEAIDKVIEKKLLGREMEALKEAYPDWHTIVGAVDTSKGDLVDPNNPFRAWLATQPKEYQEKIETANRPSTITAAIDKFKKVAAKPVPPKPPTPPAKPPAAQPKPNRFEAAITPRGDGRPPPPAPQQTLEDAFNAGFNGR